MYTTLVKLTRRITFSAGHRYWLSSLTPEENRARFGVWANPFNHGHNFILDVTTEGTIDPETGMVVNIKWIDDVLQEDIVAVFDQKSINDEVPSSIGQVTSLENLLLDMEERLIRLPSEAKLTHLRLEEMPTLWADLNTQTRAMTLTRTFEFAAAHRLDNPSLTPERNWELYNKCGNPAGHGHNYVLEVTVGGEPSPETGFLCDLSELERVVHAEIVDRYDHKNLNCDVPELQGKITTSEVVVQAIWDRLVGVLPGLVRVRLHETARNCFEVSR